VSDRTEWLTLVVDTGDGMAGFGEFSDSGTLDDALLLLPAVRSLVVGRDVPVDLRDVDAALRHLTDRSADCDRWLLRALCGAVSAALCDIAAQHANEPMWALLGGRRRSSVPLYANINRAAGDRRPADFARVARAAVEDGFDAVKLAPFDGRRAPGSTPVQDGIAAVAAVRDAIGPDGGIYVDVHERLTADEIARAVRPLEDARVGWLEDAVDAADLPALRRLSGMTSIPLAGGERIVDLPTLQRIATSGLLRWMLIDPKYVGGPIRAAEIVEQLPEVPITFHNPTGPVGTAMCAHLCTLSDWVGVLEFPYGEPIDRAALTSGGELITGGRLTVPEGPGLGVRMPDRR
jgi:galactonate dehydratase